MEKPLSYAQNMEDFHLWRALGEKPAGFYIDVGAGHPVADNVSLWFYERGWSGIAVEPQAALARMYPLVRPRDACVCALLGRASGQAQFLAFDKFHGLSTMVADNAAVAANLGEAPRRVTLPMTTLAALCEAQAVAEIDFLKIDVEGAEMDVLAGNDWARFRPRIIVLEAIAPGSGAPAWDVFEPYLVAQGYGFALFDTLNRFYVAKEHPEIAARFDGARADWGLVTHMYEIGRAPENPSHPDHALSLSFPPELWPRLPGVAPIDLAALAGGAPGLAEYFASAPGRIALARIACGYDGGQV